MRIVAGKLKNLSFGETTATRDYPSGAAHRLVNMITSPDGRLRRRPAFRFSMSINSDAGDRFMPVIHRTNGLLLFTLAGQNTISPKGFASLEERAISAENYAYLMSLNSATNVPSFANVGAIGEGSSIGDWHVVPVAQVNGDPIMSILIGDQGKSSDCLSKATIQPTTVVEKKTYSIVITRSNGKRAAAHFTTPVTEFPGTLDTSDIPAVITQNGQTTANPQYSQLVSARQAAYARERAQWIQTASQQTTTSGIVSSFVEIFANRSTRGPDREGAAYWSFEGDASGMVVQNLGQAIGISVTDGSHITYIDYPPEWKHVFRRALSRDALVPRGVDNQIVLLGDGSSALQFNRETSQWEEIPRAQISGGLSAIAMKTTGVTGGHYIEAQQLNYGSDVLPRPTAATIEMADTLAKAGSPIKVMNISNRASIVFERAIAISHANKPLDFFPRSTVQPSPADGAVIEIVQGNDEIIIDATPTRTGAFVLTTRGAYTVEATDMTQPKIRRVVDSAFPPNATHNIASISGAIWHYWRTEKTQSLSVYTESSYGDVWSHSDPIPHYRINSSVSPTVFSAILAVPSGDVVYLVRDSEVKVFTKIGDFYSVSTIQQHIGTIRAAIMSGDYLVTCINNGTSHLICKYLHTDVPGWLDAQALDVPHAPVKSHLYVDGKRVAAQNANRIFRGGADVALGVSFQSAATFLPPQHSNISTPSATGNLRDVTVNVIGRSFAFHDGTTTRTYTQGARLGTGAGEWSATHPIYREGTKMFTVMSGVNEDECNNIEITAVTYRHTVFGDKTPSAW